MPRRRNKVSGYHIFNVHRYRTHYHSLRKREKVSVSTPKTYLNTEVAAIDVVAEEQIVGFWREAAVLE